MENQSEIAKFYANKSVFLTGATGFLGLGTTEKLLRSCPEISNLYVLVRPKINSDIHTRLAKLLKGPLFDQVRMENPGGFNKIIPIAGDISEPELGISEEDVAKLCENVSIVIHSAATINFDEKLKFAVNTNVCGTQRVVSLCKKMKQLVALVHVSTAYANCDEKEVPESIRSSKFDPHVLTRFVEMLDDKIVAAITPVLIGNKPNTYTFTKALAESLLEKEKGTLPICIVRPSIVVATYKYPISGWVNHVNGPTGLLAGYGKGIFRSWGSRTDKIADLIPLDYVSNLITAAAWDIAKTNPTTITVYNCCTGPTNPLLWGEFIMWMVQALNKNPFSDILWVPCDILHRSYFIHRILELLLHYFPAYVIDVAAQFAGKKPIMMKIYRKLKKGYSLFQFFIDHEWDFESKAMRSLYERMCPEDRIVFSLNLQEFDWPDYMEKYCLGIRKYILLDEPDTLPAARKKLTKMRWINKAIKLVLILLFSVLMFRYFY